MAEIDWLRISSATFEDMIACLLSHLNPKVRRIDGSGGDGGRDCQFGAPGSLHVYQIKHFPGGRMGKAQRQQVKKSLATAEALNPVSWVLIVPFDHTPDEKKSFDELQEGLSFPIEWRGKTWLDLAFAERRFIADYYLGDSNAEVIRILKDIGQEKAALQNGVPDAMSRVETLVKRANTLDPHYRFTIKSDGARTEVTLKPAYEGAEQDRPITINAEFRIPTTTEEGRAKAEEFQRALDFGTPVELTGDMVPELTMDAPAGLAGTFNGPSISMGPGKPVTDEPLNLLFTISDPAGDAVATYEQKHIPETSGLKGTVLVGSDRGGYINSRVTINVKDGNYQISLRVRWERFIPHEFAPISRFLSHNHPPNTFTVSRTDGTMRSEPVPCVEELGVPPQAADFMTNFAIVQASSGIVREVTAEISSQDMANAAGAIDLMRGKECPLGWTDLTMTIAPTLSIEERRRVAAGPVFFTTTVDAPVMLDICGITYPVGKRHRQRVRALVDPASIKLLTADHPTGDIVVALHPDPADPSAWVKLVN